MNVQARAKAVASTMQRNGVTQMRPQTFWFQQRPALSRCFGLSEYKQCATDGWRFGFARQDFHTMLVDLRVTPEEQLARFQPRTRSVVRKGERLGIVSQLEFDYDGFLKIYNRFAKRRGLAQLGQHHVLASPSKTVITKAVLDGRAMVMRGYLVDRETGRVRNLVNCSIEHDTADKEMPRLVGIAHRFLIFADMVRFGAEGHIFYDFGGYAKGTSDPKLMNINRFKDCFGGRVVSEPNYLSWPLHLALRARNWTRRTGKSGGNGSAADGSA